MSRQTCADCRFYQIKPANLGAGDCHHELKSAVVNTPQGAMIVGGWVEVKTTDVACAKFEALVTIQEERPAGGLGITRPLGGLGVRR